MMTTQELIEAQSKRLLTRQENAQLIANQYKGTASQFRRTINKAYAIAKTYDNFGGSKLYNELMHLFTQLGSSNFSDLYLAAKLKDEAESPFAVESSFARSMTTTPVFTDEPEPCPHCSTYHTNGDCYC